MGLLDRFFKKKQEILADPIVEESSTKLNPDEQFVADFKALGGKFLYCTKPEEVLSFLKNIFEENAWETAFCFNDTLSGHLNVIGIPKDKEAQVFYTTCEHLIVEDASLLFSSNQLKEVKLAQYPENFIVFATTSQLLFTKDEGLTSIKHRFKKEIPTNISAIRDYMPHKKDPNFLNYGNMNSKNLYLILLENL